MQTHELSVPKLITAARARAVPKSKLIPLRLFQGGGVSFWSVYNIRTSRPETAVDGGSERPAGNRMTSGGRRLRSIATWSLTIVMAADERARWRGGGSFDGRDRMPVDLSDGVAGVRACVCELFAKCHFRSRRRAAARQPRRCSAAIGLRRQPSSARRTTVPTGLGSRATAPTSGGFDSSGGRLRSALRFRRFNVFKIRTGEPGFILVIVVSEKN